MVPGTVFVDGDHVSMENPYHDMQLPTNYSDHRPKQQNQCNEKVE
jgi:hypothetical protein